MLGVPFSASPLPFKAMISLKERTYLVLSDLESEAGISVAETCLSLEISELAFILVVWLFDFTDAPGADDAQVAGTFFRRPGLSAAKEGCCFTWLKLILRFRGFC